MNHWTDYVEPVIAGVVVLAGLTLFGSFLVSLVWGLIS